MPEPVDQAVRALLITDQEDDKAAIEKLLTNGSAERLTLDWAAADGDARAASQHYDVCFLAAPLDSPSAKQLLGRTDPDMPPVILFTDRGDRGQLGEAIEAGAVDALPRAELSGPLLAAATRYAIDRRKAERRLAELALHDPLTGLANQILVWEMLDHGLARAKRNKSNLGILMIYIEGVGEINESSGREEGDRALAIAARRLQSLLRATDTVGRFGGTKLVVILDTISQPEDLNLMSEKIVGAICEPVILDGVTAQLSCSVGIALYPWTTASAESLIRHATAAMDAVQERGGNDFMFG